MFSGIMTKPQNKERERDLTRPDLLGASRCNCWGRCNCLCSLKLLDLFQSVVGSASIQVFHSDHVNCFLHSLLQSGFTAVVWRSTPKERQCPCFFLLPTWEGSKMRWWRKGPPSCHASHKPPKTLPVSKHSPPLSSFHAVYSTYSKSTNPTQTRQSCFLPKGLCKQNKLAVIMYVAPIACKTFASSANLIRFPLWLPAPHFPIPCLCTGVREEVLLSSPVPTRKHSPHSVSQHHSNSTATLLIPCHQCPITVIIWPPPAGRSATPAWTTWKATSSDTQRIAPHCQRVPLYQLCCQTPPKSDSSLRGRAGQMGTQGKHN